MVKRKASSDGGEERPSNSPGETRFGYPNGYCWVLFFLHRSVPDLGPWPTREELLEAGAPEGGPVSYVGGRRYHVDPSGDYDLESIPEGSMVGGLFEDVSDQSMCTRYRNSSGLEKELAFRSVSVVHCLRYRSSQEKGIPYSLTRWPRYLVKDFRKRDNPRRGERTIATRIRNFVPYKVLGKSKSLRKKKLLYATAPTSLNARAQRDESERLIEQDLASILDSQSYFFAMDEPTSIIPSLRVEANLGRVVPVTSLSSRDVYRESDGGPYKQYLVNERENELFSAIESSVFGSTEVETFEPPMRGMKGVYFPPPMGVSPASGSNLGVTAETPSVVRGKKKKTQRAFFEV